MRLSHRSFAERVELYLCLLLHCQRRVMGGGRFDQEYLELALRKRWRAYDAEAMKQHCLAARNLPAVAIILELQQDWPASVLVRLSELESSAGVGGVPLVDVLEEMRNGSTPSDATVEEAVEQYVRSAPPGVVDGRAVAELLSGLVVLTLCLTRAADGPAEKLAQCLVHVLRFWGQQRLPLAPLEEVLLGQLGRPGHGPRIGDALALLIAAAPDQLLLEPKPEDTKFSIFKDEPAVGSLDGHRPLLLPFSAEFYHAVLQQRVTELHRRAATAAHAGDGRGGLEQICDHHRADIAGHMRKAGGPSGAIKLSAGELRKLASTEYGVQSTLGSTLTEGVLLFSCGHQYLRSKFFEVELPALKRDFMKRGGETQLLTLQVLTKQYHCQNPLLACCKCVFADLYRKAVNE
jgi:hypothetical protein